MVLLAVVGTAGSEFISQAFLGFADTEARTQIYEEGKTALVRLEKEIHLAVPNAVDISADGTTMSLGLIDEVAMRSLFGRYTEEDPTATNSITDHTAGLPLNSLISVYNSNWSSFASGSRIYAVTSNNSNPMILDSSIASGAASPYQRFYVVRDKAIQYQVSGTTMYRLTASVDSSGVGTFATAKPIAKNVSQTDSLPYFDYTAGGSNKNARVAIHFTLTTHGESINFYKEIHIRNVP